MCRSVFIPAIDMKSVSTIADVCRKYPSYAYPMLGLHPEEVRADYAEILQEMRKLLGESKDYIAIGEVGLDFYWSREFEKEQLMAFEEQVRWSVETHASIDDSLSKGSERDGAHSSKRIRKICQEVFFTALLVTKRKQRSCFRLITSCSELVEY